MSELKHTPGPWTYEVHELSEGMSAIVYDDKGKALADHLSEDEARVMAAAPAMLQALRRLQGCLPIIFEALDLDPAETFVRISDHGTGRELAKITLAQILAEQDAAIAAATGGA